METFKAIVTNVQQTGSFMNNKSNTMNYSYNIMFNNGKFGQYISTQADINNIKFKINEEIEVDAEQKVNKNGASYLKVRPHFSKDSYKKYSPEEIKSINYAKSIEITLILYSKLNINKEYFDTITNTIFNWVDMQTNKLHALKIAPLVSQKFAYNINTLGTEINDIINNWTNVANDLINKTNSQNFVNQQQNSQPQPQQYQQQSPQFQQQQTQVPQNQQVPPFPPQQQGGQNVFNSPNSGSDDIFNFDDSSSNSNDLVF